MRTTAAGLAAAFALVLLGPGPAAAQPVSGVSGPDTYVELHLGAYVPQHDDLDAFDTGLDLGGTFGARFTPNLSVEGELSYLRASGQAGPADLTLQSFPFAVSARLTFPLRTVALHVLAGASIHLAKISAEGDLSGGIPASDRATAFGFHVGAGAGFYVWDQTRVGVELRRTFIEAPFDEDVRLDGLRVAVTLTYDL